MFGPREQLLTSEQPVVKQFLSGDRFGPIGMSEEKDEAVAAAEAAMQAAGISGGGTKDDFTEIIPQVQPNPGMPERQAAIRHRARVHEMLHTLPPNAQEAIVRSMAQEDEIKAQNRAERAQAHAAAGVGVGKPQADYAGDDAVTQSWAVVPGVADGPTVEYEVPNEGGRHSS